MKNERLKSNIFISIFSLLSTPNKSTRPSSPSSSSTHHQHPLSCLSFRPNFNSNQFLWQRLDHLLPAIWNHYKHLTTKMFFVPKFPQQIFIVAFATPIAKKILACFSATYRQFSPPKGNNSWSQNSVVVGKLQIYKTRRPGTKPTKTTSDQTWTDQANKRTEHHINH